MMHLLGSDGNQGLLMLNIFKIIFNNDVSTLAYWVDSHDSWHGTLS